MCATRGAECATRTSPRPSHYRHVSDTIETAVAHGLTTLDTGQELTSFRELVVSVWMPLSIALNQINRSMGTGAPYPFVSPTGAHLDDSPSHF